MVDLGDKWLNVRSEGLATSIKPRPESDQFSLKPYLSQTPGALAISGLDWLL
jgi:hypothetical protein